METIYIKHGIILFWAVWLSLVLLLNFLDIAKNLRLLPENWKFNSGNFWFISSVVKVYSTPTPIIWVLYVSAVIWEIVAVYLLWAAGFDPTNLRLVNLAFFINLALWAAFVVMDEFFLAFLVPGHNIMETHRSLFIANLLTLMAVHLLPNT